MVTIKEKITSALTPGDADDGDLDRSIAEVKTAQSWTGTA
jgi:hypothetical protein